MAVGGASRYISTAVAVDDDFFFGVLCHNVQYSSKCIKFGEDIALEGRGII